MNKVEQKDPFLNVRTPIYLTHFTPRQSSQLCFCDSRRRPLLYQTHVQDSLNNVDLCHDKLSVVLRYNSMWVNFGNFVLDCIARIQLYRMCYRVRYKQMNFKFLSGFQKITYVLVRHTLFTNIPIRSMRRFEIIYHLLLFKTNT